MRKITALLLLFVFALPGAAADTRLDPESPAKTIAPFVDDQTVAVAHVDLMRLDAARVVDVLSALVSLADDQVGPVKHNVQQWIADFKKAGGKDLYIVANLDDLPRHLSVVVPIEDDASARGILELLRSTKSAGLTQYVPLPLAIETMERVDQAIFAGSKAALARLRARKPAQRPEVAKAFTAAGDNVAQLLLVPTAEVRRAIEEIIPTLPHDIGDGPSTVLTHGFLWAAIGANGPPNARLRLLIQSQDAASAQSLAAWFAKLYQAVSRDKSVRRSVPNLDNILPLLAPTVKMDQLTLRLDLSKQETSHLLSTLAPLVTEPIRRNHCAENLRRLGLALHTYHDVHKTFPAQANFDSTGKPLLSWRVHILPYVGEQELYQEFHLNEPWDSEHNRKLIARMPAVYHCPSMSQSLRNKTTYLAPVHESAMFTGTAEGVPMKQVKDGTSNTIFVVDATDEHAVLWTKPEDLKYDPKNPRRGLVGHHDSLILALFVDGSIRFLPGSMDEKTLLAVFTRAGGETAAIPE